MKKKEKLKKINWYNFLSGETELECESIEDAKLLFEVCKENGINCSYLSPEDWSSEPYLYIKNNSLKTTKYTLECDDICECSKVKYYIENHEQYIEQEENKIMDMKPVTELKDTAEMMSSSDYKERFRAEYAQVVIRYQKLQDMLNKWDNNELDFTPNCPRSTYDFQIRAMRDYIGVLGARAAMEGIVL